MRKLLIISAVLVFSAMGTKAQSDFLQRFSIEAMGGLGNYHGELNEKFFTLDQAKPSIGLGLGYKLTNKISLRGLISYGNVEAHDKFSAVEDNRRRNLHFFSKIYDAHLVAQYHFLDIDEYRFTPYVFGGGSIFHMGPYTTDPATGQLIGFRNIRTEGQGLFAGSAPPFNLWQISIPFGAGVKFAVNSKVNLGWEVRFHKTFTDHLDDVSGNYVTSFDVFDNLRSDFRNQAIRFSYRGDELNHAGADVYPFGQPRGNPNNKDWFYYTGLTLSYRIFGHNDRPGKGIACPKW